MGPPPKGRNHSADHNINQCHVCELVQKIVSSLLLSTMDHSNTAKIIKEKEYSKDLSFIKFVYQILYQILHNISVVPSRP